MNNPIEQDQIVYKGYTYEFLGGEHKLSHNESGDVFYLKHTFDITHIPKLAEIMDVIDAWIKRGI